MSKDEPIGVFDSGIGGLTILTALRARLPTEEFIYLGDTARVPYGTREASTVRRYAVNNTRTLQSIRPLKALVVACNTASAVSIDVLRAEFDFPVIGVIEPGARAAAAASDGGGIHILATRGTVSSAAYPRALNALGYKGQITQTACPLLVPLVEEGWVSGTVTDQVVAHYIGDIPEKTDVIVLGCTHFPLLRSVIEKAAPGLQVVDGGAMAASDLVDALGASERGTEGEGSLKVWVTDGAAHTHSMAERFLGTKIADADFSLIELEMS